MVKEEKQFFNSCFFCLEGTTTKELKMEHMRLLKEYDLVNVMLFELWNKFPETRKYLESKGMVKSKEEKQNETNRKS